MRVKIIKNFNVTLKEPCVYKVRDGKYGIVRTLDSNWSHHLVEMDGNSFISLCPDEKPYVYRKLFVAIKESFDELEGQDVTEDEEFQKAWDDLIMAGGNAS